MPSRRVKGEGYVSAKKRADGRWEARLDLGYVAGKRQYKSVYGRTRAEVTRKLAELQNTVNRGLPVTPEKITVAAYLAQWIEQRRDHVKPQTWRREEGIVRNYLSRLNGPLSRLQPASVASLYREALEGGRSPGTVGTIHITLHRALRQAVEWGLAARNVADLVRPPRYQRHEITPLTEGQASLFLEEAGSDAYYALYVLALTTGMRQGELLGLRWSDIDLEGRTIDIRRNMQRVRGAWINNSPKGNRQRWIELPPITISALKEHRNRQLETRILHANLWQNYLDLVFPNEIGEPIQPKTLQRRSFQPILTRAGLPRIRFHDLRHTAATLMLGRGVPIHVVSQILGHASIATTVDIYGHVTPGMQRQAADAMDAILGKVK